MSPGPDGTEASRREVLSRALVEEGDRLYALALRTTRDPDLAADAVQEAFASALEKAEGFPSEKDYLPRIPIAAWRGLLFTSLAPTVSAEMILHTL
mgnify:CR=1 FL=1